MNNSVSYKRYNINDARADQSESVYVLAHASRFTKKPTHVLLPHTPRDSGNTNSIEVPMTINPIDLSLFAPKDELIRNTEFMSLVQRGILELIPEERAQAMLATPEGRAETERLAADQLRRLATPDARNVEEHFRTTFPEHVRDLPQTAPGDIDKRMAGVSPAVVNIIKNAGMDDSARASMLRNHAQMGTLTAADKQWVRANTSDARIREIVA